MGKQPNILFIMADQMGASFTGCYGSGVNSTPTLDALATRGVRFDRFYAHCPVCAPNRATILTGRSPEIHGLVSNNFTLTPDNPTYPMSLQQAGYRTGGFGKFHLTPMMQPLPENLNYLGFDESIPTEDPKLGPWLDWVEREHPEHYEKALSVSWPMPYINAYGPEKRDLREAMTEARRKHLAPMQAKSPWPHMHPSPLPAALHQTTWITDLSLDFMERKLDGGEAPFFCFTSYVDPHDLYDPPAPYDTMFRPEDMPAPIPMAKPHYDSQVLEDARRFAGFENICHNKGAVAQLRAWYHGSIRLIDDQVKRMIDMLDARGALENTIVVFTTDHGDMMADHGFMTKGVKHYDTGIRCPMIVAGPGIARGAVSDRLSSSIDLFPTFCDWAGVRTLPPVEGRSMAQNAADAVTDDGWDVVPVQAPYSAPSRTVQSIISKDGWRFTIIDEPDEGQMFNLVDDPLEQRDLFKDPNYAEKRAELHHALTRAYMFRGYVQQHRSLPVEAGEKRLVGITWALEPMGDPSRCPWLNMDHTPPEKHV